MALTIDPALLPIWQAWLDAEPHSPNSPKISATAIPPILHGLAGERRGPLATVLIASSPPVDPERDRALSDGFAAHFGVARVELIALPAQPLSKLLRQWVYQAAQGTGRGVEIEIEHGAGGETVLQLTAIDSSARELVWRLASPHEPGLRALEVLIGSGRVTVRDAESG